MSSAIMQQVRQFFGINGKNQGRQKSPATVEYAGTVMGGRFERLIAGDKRPFSELVRDYEKTTSQYKNSFGNLEPMLYVSREGEFGTLGTVDFRVFDSSNGIEKFTEDVLSRLDASWKTGKAKEKIKSGIIQCQSILYEEGINCPVPNQGAGTELGRSLEKIGIERHVGMVISRTDVPAMKRVFEKRGWEKLFKDRKGNSFYGKFLE